MLCMLQRALQLGEVFLSLFFFFFALMSYKALYSSQIAQDPQAEF